MSSACSTRARDRFPCTAHVSILSMSILSSRASVLSSIQRAWEAHGRMGVVTLRTGVRPSYLKWSRGSIQTTLPCNTVDLIAGTSSEMGFLGLSSASAEWHRTDFACHRHTRPLLCFSTSITRPPQSPSGMATHHSDLLYEFIRRTPSPRPCTSADQ